MNEIVKLFVAAGVLIIGFPIGLILAKYTKEELKQGQKWFKRIIVVSLVGGFIGLFLKNDVLMFSLFFIAIVTSGSLSRPKLRKKK
jgi:hypothetical protein